MAPDLGKLTVPQLKALCKERRITGYSKLSKAALLEKLAPNTTPSAIRTDVPAKRPAHTDSSAPPKRTRTNVQETQAVCSRGVHQPTPTTALRDRTATTNIAAHTDTPASLRTTELPKQIMVVGSSSFKVPELPVRSPQGPTLTERPPLVSRTSTGTARFKPLIPNPAGASSVCEPPADVHSLATLPVLSHISFPPKMSERKWVYKWAIILSALSPTDRQTCALVSRMFRYAVYLSAEYILSKNYAGRRLDPVFKLHSRNMTNFWPYLRVRADEVRRRRFTYNQSFLGQYATSLGYAPLSARLWTSPDDEKQVDIALRFVLTRMWFAISLGAYGHDATAWSKSVVYDVREVVKGEIWHVLTRHDGDTCSFYVLEETCEVIGTSSSGAQALGYGLRADWTAWISQRSSGGDPQRSLVESVSWSNAEDYRRGISKAWLHRIQNDALGVAKRTVAERYILASVVANGISGQWMSTNAMAQEFAGLACASAVNPRTTQRSTNTVNLYLAAHHHVESVHFTTAKGEALHAAVAVVQTTAREYYVLRENGMQVGCEEEGIPEIWQWVLGCDALGRPSDTLQQEIQIQMEGKER